MDYKSFPAQFEVKNEAEGIIEGYASVFGNKDSWGDIVERGAFTKTLQEGGGRVKVLWQHDWWSPIGKPLHMEEDSKGLFTRSKIAPTSIGKDALALIKEGVINELSIGYDTVKETYDHDSKTRHLLEVKLWEYSLVTWAANDLAVITGAKSLDDLRPLLQRMRGLDLVLKSPDHQRLAKDAISALQALLDAVEGGAEPAKTTPPAAPAPGAASNNDGEPDTHSLAELLEPLNQLKAVVKEQRLLDELRGFGKSLREVS